MLQYFGYGNVNWITCMVVMVGIIL